MQKKPLTAVKIFITTFSKRIYDFSILGIISLCTACTYSMQISGGQMFHDEIRPFGTFIDKTGAARSVQVR